MSSCNHYKEAQKLLCSIVGVILKILIAIFINLFICHGINQAGEPTSRRGLDDFDIKFRQF